MAYKRQEKKTKSPETQHVVDLVIEMTNPPGEKKKNRRILVNYPQMSNWVSRKKSLNLFDLLES